MSKMIFPTVQSDPIRHPRSNSSLVDFRLLHCPPRFIPVHLWFYYHDSVTRGLFHSSKPTMQLHRYHLLNWSQLPIYVLVLLSRNYYCYVPSTYGWNSNIATIISGKKNEDIRWRLTLVWIRWQATVTLLLFSIELSSQQKSQWKRSQL